MAGEYKNQYYSYEFEKPSLATAQELLLHTTKGYKQFKKRELQWDF